MSKTPSYRTMVKRAIRRKEKHSTLLRSAMLGKLACDVIEDGVWNLQKENLEDDEEAHHSGGNV